MTQNKSQRELEQAQQNLEYQTDELRVVVADIVEFNNSKNENLEDRMVELENLVTTYGGVVIVRHVQHKTKVDYNTYIGEGRLDEIIEEMRESGANVLILGNILKPSQIYKLNEKLKPIWAKAWDRVDLILKIFEKNALSRESKLQIQLAAIKHMGPRIYDMGMELGKQSGKGRGETNTEIMKRHLQKQIQHIKKELDHFSKVRAQHRQARSNKGLSTVWVVGYTNAGKSTLTNILTHKWVLAEDKLFATLGTSVGKMWLAYPAPVPNDQGEELGTGTYKNWKPWRDILINDTIGFIRELPPKLIEAFTSTLEDSIESELLLHVIDASDPKMAEKIQVVDDILESIGASQQKLYIFNKLDALPGGWNAAEIAQLSVAYEHLNPIFISAHANTWIEALKKLIWQKI